MTLRSISSLFLLLFTTFAFGQQENKNVDWSEYFNKIEIANSHYHNQEYLKSANAYSEAFDFINQGFSVGHRYQAACAWAMAGQKDSAFSNLTREVKTGLYDYKKMKNEKALSSLHGEKQWRELRKEVKKNQKVENKKLGKYKNIKPHLENILVLDQLYRKDYMEIRKKYGDKSPEWQDLMREMTHQDQSNLKYVLKILEKYGWVSYDTIGYKASQALFLVIQHSDSSTQEKYLPLLKQAVKDKNAFGNELALLEDRVLIKRGKNQIYGSQVKCDGTGKNCWVLPIEDEINVDRRRTEVGLQPLAEYLKIWNIVYIKPH